MSKKMENKNNTQGVNEEEQALSPEQDKIWDEIMDCIHEIKSLLSRELRMSGNYLHECYDTCVAAFLLYKAFDYNDPASVSFSALEESGIDSDILRFAKNGQIDSCWDQLLPLTNRHQQMIFFLVSKFFVESQEVKLQDGEYLPYESDEYASYLETNDYIQPTPTALLELAEAILEVKNGERVADLCCGVGKMASQINNSVSGASIF